MSNESGSPPSDERDHTSTPARPSSGSLLPEGEATTVHLPRGGLLAPRSAGPADGKTGSRLCQVLLEQAAITQADIDRALATQEEHGGQIGRILVAMGACTEEAIARALIEQLRQRRKGHFRDISAAARKNPDVAGLRVLCRPGLTTLTLVAIDLFSLVVSAFLAVAIHWARTGHVGLDALYVAGPEIAINVLVFASLDLYSPIAKAPPDEIRGIVLGSTLLHASAAVITFFGDLPISIWGFFVRGVWWSSTLVLVPILRALVRGTLSRQGWWGLPVVVLGAAKTGRLVVRTLKAQPRSGLKPVLLLDDDAGKQGTLRASFANEAMNVYSINVSATEFLSDATRRELIDDLLGPESGEHPSSARIPAFAPVQELSPDSGQVAASGGDPSFSKARDLKVSAYAPRGKFAEVEGIPVVGDLSLAPHLAKRLKIPYAVVAMPGVDSGKLLGIVERVGGAFSHLLVIPDLFGFASLGVPAKSIGGILGVEVRQQLLLPGPRLAKRALDLALTIPGMLVVLPFLLLIALVIKLDSRGPIFYHQLRLGRDGEHFRAYKFRTMHGDGEERLKALLESDPALRAEYAIYHKLKKDPRVTRFGRILRKFSLDEFPQLINVLLGDMSLVGPRPYIERELPEMNGQERIILRATPGMTGMWQVSDRNAMSFAGRVELDVHYVRNWSPWLDVYILARTFGVVIKGTGT